MKKLTTCLLALVLLGTTALHAQEVIEKTFKAYKTIRIKTVSGDVELVKAKTNAIKVKVAYRVDPDGAFEPEFHESSQYLRLSENWSGRSYDSEVLWTVELPADVKVKFSSASGDLRVTDLDLNLDASTASGDLELMGVEGELELNTASGEIILSDAKGEFELSTASGDIDLDDIQGIIECSAASGDIDIKNAQGEIECSVASGDVDATQLKLTAPASFSAASGDVDVKLNGALNDDISLSTASGSATLDFNGKPMKGFFEMQCRVRRGRIIAPFAFDNEERFERYDQEYIKKTAKIKSDTPRIEISTASGRASVLK